MRDITSRLRKRFGRSLMIAAAVVLTPLALFYLFVVPMLVASDPHAMDEVGVAFGAFLLVQLFGLVILMAWEAAGSFYGFSPTLPKWLGGLDRSRGALRRLPAVHGIAMMFISYAAFLYAYGVLYTYVSHIDPAAFGGGLSGFDAVYFSTITAATVGYGDIAPQSDLAKAIVISEVLIGLLYVVLLFSACAAALQARRLHHEPGSQPVAPPPSEQPAAEG